MVHRLSSHLQKVHRSPFRLEKVRFHFWAKRQQGVGQWWIRNLISFNLMNREPRWRQAKHIWNGISLNQAAHVDDCCMLHMVHTYTTCAITQSWLYKLECVPSAEEIACRNHKLTLIFLNISPFIANWDTFTDQKPCHKLNDSLASNREDVGMENEAHHGFGKDY